jgi:hypothetical protein
MSRLPKPAGSIGPSSPEPTSSRARATVAGDSVGEDPAPREVVLELASILAKGYVRLLARIATPGAPSQAEEVADYTSESLDDFGEGSPHGRRG